MEMFNGALDEAARFGQSVNVLPIPGGWIQSGQSRLLAHCDDRVDGLILVAPTLLEPGFLTSLRERTPLVTIHAHRPEAAVPDLEANDESGLYAATSHLIALGHRRIAQISGPGSHRDARERVEGFMLAHAQAGLAVDPRLMVEGDFEEKGGQAAMNRLLDSGIPFTAAVCGNDQMLFGARLGLMRRGLRVPEDVSLVGFDDLPIARYMTPPVTTVRQPMFEFGLAVAAALLSALGATPVRPTAVPAVSLVVRESTCAPRPDGA